VNVTGSSSVEGHNLTLQAVENEREFTPAWLVSAARRYYI